MHTLKINEDGFQYAEMLVLSRRLLTLCIILVPIRLK